MAVYWILQVQLLLKLFSKGDKVFLKNNSNWLKWQKVYNSFQFFVFFPTLLFLILGLENQLYNVINLSAGISVLLTAVSIFFYPGILYNVRNLEILSWKDDEGYQPLTVKLPTQTNGSIKDFRKRADGLFLSHLNENFDSTASSKVGWNYKAKTSNPLVISNEEERKYYHFTTEQVEQITGQLNELMEKEKPYLKEGYSIKDLAYQINLPAYQLSAFINIETGVHFNDFINRLRISYCEELIGKGESDNLNLFGLAAKCGFHNRNTFTAAFKKYTGLTPSAFLKSNQKFLRSNNGSI
jgi:AraC-like DNA-binding protein